MVDGREKWPDKLLFCSFLSITNEGKGLFLFEFVVEEKLEKNIILSCFLSFFRKKRRDPKGGRNQKT